MDPQALLAQADKKATGTSGFFSKMLGSSSFQLEEAAELYIQAANAFRLNKDGRSAGRAFEKAATSQKNSDAKDDAANTLVEAYKAYRQTDPKDAVRVLEEAIHLFTLRGQFRRAANYQMDLGAIYESDLDDRAKAVSAYENAGDWYFNDQAEALSNKAFLKVAEIAALNDQFDVAVDNFDRVAKQSLNSNLSKWSLKEYFVKAVFCHLAAGDVVATDRAMEQYVEWDPSFGSTKEHEFLQNITDAFRAGDEQEFTNKLWEFDRFSKLDKWKIAVALKIKSRLQGAADEEAENELL